MDQPMVERGVLKTVEAAGDVRLERALVGFVSARDVTIQQAGAGPVAAQGNVGVSMGGCGPVLARGDVSIQMGGCGPVLAGGNVSIEQGGCGPMIAGGGATIGRGAFVGAIVSPKVTVEDGAKVLVGTPGAFAAGALVGALAALMIRRRR
jgi:hypothetical protein